MFSQNQSMLWKLCVICDTYIICLNKKIVPLLRQFAFICNFYLTQPNDILLNQGCVNNTDFAVMVYIAVKKLSLAEFYNTYNIFLNRCCISNRNVSVWICITASQAVQFATNRCFTLCAVFKSAIFISYKARILAKLS